MSWRCNDFSTKIQILQCCSAKCLIFFPVLCKQIWHLYKMESKGNETIVNDEEVLKGQFSSRFALIFNLMTFFYNL